VIKKFNIGIVRGYHFAVVGTQGMNPIMAKNVSHLFTLLEHDRIDVAVTILIGGKLEIATNFTDKGIHVIGKSLHSAPLFHYVNKTIFN